MFCKWLLINIFLLSAIAGITQDNYCWQWRKDIGNGIPGSNKLVSVNNAFVYTGGEFANTNISIDNAVFINKGGTDIVVVKRDTKGNIIWLKTIGGPSDDRLSAMSIDEQGAVYIGGSFSGSIQADTVTLLSKGGTDIFIAKYAPGGKLEWVKIIGSPGNEYLSSLVKDTQQVRFAGSFSGTLSIGQFTLTDTAGASFTASLQEADATVLYAYNFHNPNGQYQRMDKKGNIYCAGITSYPYTIGNITISPSCETWSYNPNYTTYAAFLWGAKFDSTGKLLWVKDLLPCNAQPTLQFYREYFDFYIDESGYIYISFVEGRWPAQYGPSPGDPYMNQVSVLSSDGVMVGGGYTMTYGFLGTGVIRRYFLHAANKKVLLKNTKVNQIEYIPTISLLDINENRLIYNYTNFIRGFIDADKKAFYFTDNTQLSKLGVEMEVNAGPDRTVCASYQLPILLGDSITGSCGIPPYTYQWTPSTGLSSDTVARPTVQLDQIGQEQEYYLTVQGATGIIKRDTVKIIKNAVPDKPLIKAVNNVLIAASPVNGNYQWYCNDSLLSEVNSNLLPVKKDGAYRVKITDTNFCSAVSDTFYAYKITINAGYDTAICKGEMLQLGATPTGFATAGVLTYEWIPSLYLSDASSANPVAVPNNDICYKLIINNSYGNNAFDSVCIRILPVPTTVISQQGDVLHSGYSTGNKWFFNGQPVVNATGESLVFYNEGEYTVHVTDSNGCSALSPVYYATHTQLSLAVYPSPVSVEMNIQFNLPKAGAITIEIFNISNGIRKVIVNNVYQVAGQNTKNIKTAGYSKGIYMVRIKTPYGSVTRKFVVQ
jgi:hypothetical protein